MGKIIRQIGHIQWAFIKRWEILGLNIGKETARNQQN
jgi:hypothetical protein